MKKIQTLTVEYEDGTSETWRGAGTAHLTQTQMGRTGPHTMQYVTAVLTPHEKPKPVKEVLPETQDAN